MFGIYSAFMCLTDRNWLGISAGVLALFWASGLVITSSAQEKSPADVPVISLSEAIHRAQQNEPTFANALATQKSAIIDRYLAKATLLPSVEYHNQMLYTQPNGQTNQGGQAGTQASPIFIANNAVHEYTSQAIITERVGLKQFADVQVASANAARSSAELEVARRGPFRPWSACTIRFQFLRPGNISSRRPCARRSPSRI